MAVQRGPGEGHPDGARPRPVDRLGQRGVHLVEDAVGVLPQPTAFVRAAAIEIVPQRINAVSSTIFTEDVDKYGASFPGFLPVDLGDVAATYVRSIEGAQPARSTPFRRAGASVAVCMIGLCLHGRGAQVAEGKSLMGRSSWRRSGWVVRSCA
ncbi:hypothetical protein [Nonomuraea sp. NPDC049709]|uniref:hypothetical protein n=1 Tax=Nonomuraea sp. NPDC049709 TaxID=3154736 RepID=UPI00343C0410